MHKYSYILQMLRTAINTSPLGKMTTGGLAQLVICFLLKFPGLEWYEIDINSS